jgi:hypothetical protein
VNAGQLSMFEPEGDVLATLAAKHAMEADRLARAADAWNVQGYTGTAATLARQASQAADMASTCELALQFERQAGIA